MIRTCIIRSNTVYGPTSGYKFLFQLPSHSNLLTPYSIFVYMLVILRASAKLKSFAEPRKRVGQKENA
jgi:hypothetical protein